MENKNNILNNSDLNNILKKTPHFIVRNGITILTCLIIIAFISSFFIIIPQITYAKIQDLSSLSNNNTDIIRVKVDNYNIQHLFVNQLIDIRVNKKISIKGQIIDIIRVSHNNNNDYDVIIFLAQNVKSSAINNQDQIEIITKYNTIGEFLVKPIQGLLKYNSIVLLIKKKDKCLSSNIYSHSHCFRIIKRCFSKKKFV